uniref:DUF7795 domain-containing protein n=1 Tax=Oryza meridionalis TaxID=40149 RepID=A0A0E0EWX9_9ORYZ
MASPDACVEDKVHRIFLDFMTKVARYDELVDAGKKVLLKFHQEVEHFRRPKLLTKSGAIIEIVKSNYSDRMRSYLEAGCTHHDENIQNMNWLHACQEKLNDHINKAKLLLEELQFLEEDVYSAALTASLSSSRNTDDCPDDDNLTNVCSEDEQQPEDWLDRAVSFASVIVLVHNMLKLDYMMQEKIVKALWVKTPLSEIEGYCQMWDLQPYIDDNVMQLAWQLVSYRAGHVPAKGRKVAKRTKALWDRTADRVEAEVEVSEPGNIGCGCEATGEAIVGEVDPREGREVGDAGWDFSGEALCLHVQGHHQTRLSELAGACHAAPGAHVERGIVPCGKGASLWA